MPLRPANNSTLVLLQTLSVSPCTDADVCTRRGLGQDQKYRRQPSRDLVEAAGSLKQMLPIDLTWLPGHEFSGVVEQIRSAHAAGDAGAAALRTRRR
jgi:hypothetical protein